MNIHKLVRDFQVTAVATGEIWPVMQVKKGDRILSTSLMALKAAASTTDTFFVLGDGSTINGFQTAFDTEANAAGKIVSVDGAYMLTAGGKLYDADDTIDLEYDESTTEGAVAPKIRVTIRYTNDITD